MNEGTRVPPDQTTPHARTPLSPWIVVGFGMACTYVTYAPGLMPVDAQDQYRQAQTGALIDWHPPIMAWLWSQISSVIPGPEGFFFLLIALYWSGFFFILRYVSCKSNYRYWITSALPFLPFLYNFAGTIWKDVLVFGCFLVALGIILVRSRYRARSTTSIIIVCVLLLTGSLARYNSALSTIPLIVLLIWPLPSQTRPLTSIIFRILLCTPLVLTVWVTMGKLLDYNAFHAKKAGIENSLFVWDIVGISQTIDENLLPGEWSPTETETILEHCYSPSTVNTLILFECNFVYRDLVQNDRWSAVLLFPTWIKAIVNHPYAYATIRTRFLRTLFWPNNVFVFDADDNSNIYNHHGGTAFALVKSILAFCKSTPVIYLLFTVGFWMLLSVVVLIILCTLLYYAHINYYKSMLVSLSAVAYICPLVIVGVAGDFRYAYWSVAATCIALVIAGSDEA